MNDARAAILGRVQQALQRPAPEPEWGHDPIDEGCPFPLPTDEPGALLTRFRAELEAIAGEVIEAPSRAAARAAIEDLVRQRGYDATLVHRDPLLDEVVPAHPGLVRVDESSPSIRGWERIPLGITVAESAVAESGSVLVSSALSGRAPSVLPPHHLVVLTIDRLVPSLEAALSRLRERYGQSMPSSLSLISGPSRTADIEKILVLGAHGPRRFTVLVITG
jgi:L-lactate dehydrogenase complex protein LldG